MSSSRALCLDAAPAASSKRALWRAALRAWALCVPLKTSRPPSSPPTEGQRRCFPFSHTQYLKNNRQPFCLMCHFTSSASPRRVCSLLHLAEKSLVWWGMSFVLEHAAPDPANTPFGQQLCHVILNKWSNGQIWIATKIESTVPWLEASLLEICSD